MSGASKQVSDLLSIVGTAQRSMEIHEEKVAEGLDSLLFPDGAPRALTTQELLQRLRQVLADRTELAAQKDREHGAEKADDVGLRDARDERERGTRDLLLGFREAVAGAYGAEGCRKAGLRGALPDSPRPLVQYAKITLSQLTEANLGAPVNRWSSLDLEQMRAELGRQAEALEGALDAVERDRREGEETMLARDRSYAEARHGYIHITEIYVSLLELIGLAEEADRVRPTARRRAGRPEGADLDPDAPAAGSEDGSEDASEASREDGARAEAAADEAPST